MRKSISVLIFAVVGFFSTSTLSARHCNDDNVVIYAQTVNHKKEVEVCKVGNQYQYTFGKVNGETELTLLKDYKDIIVNDMRYQRTVQIYNGKNEYEIGYMGTDEGMNDYAIWIRQNGKQIAVVKLDPDTVKSNISNYTSSDLNTDTNGNSNNSVNKAQPKEPPYGLTVSTEIITRGVPVPYGHWKYEIRSNVDGLTVKNVTINRGKCKVIWYTNPNNLKWDDTTTFGVTTDARFSTCKPREVVIETNYGVETFKWK